MKIALLSGAYPPSVDGIGDHTRLLAKELATQHEVTVFTACQSSCTRDEGISMQGVFNPLKPLSIRHLSGKAHSPDRLIVQYNPFSFGPRGFNPWLPLTLSGLRKHCPVSVMFHEIYVPAESPTQRIMRLWQIPQFAALCRVADSLFTSCTRWMPAIRRASGRDALPLPVGSNVTRSALSRREARERLSIGEETLVLGVFGSAHPSRLRDWICTVSNRVHCSGRKLLVLSIGADGVNLHEALNPAIPFLDCGLLGAEEVGDRLMAVDLFLAPFVDGLSTRRGSVAAALQHGIPVASTSSQWTDPLLLGQEERLLFLSPVGDGATAFSTLTEEICRHLPFPEARHAAMTEFYSNHFDWPVISRRLLPGGAST